LLYPISAIGQKEKPSETRLQTTKLLAGFFEFKCTLNKNHRKLKQDQLAMDFKILK